VVDLGIDLPAAHRLVSLAERPDLASPVSDHNVAAWPDFMLEDEVANSLFNHAFRDFPQLQFVLLGPGDEIVAANNAMPLWWDGSDDGLPEGWDDQVVRSVEDLRSGRLSNTLGALQIVVASTARGGRHSGTMVEAMRAAARLAGWTALIACVRPTIKDRYPLQPIETYAFWTRDDGLPFDPWIRLHARLGGRIVKGAPRSMTMRGSVAEWVKWTGMSFPESGEYVVPGATSPVHIDRERDEGVYYDQNIWMVHQLS
jgi:hypothetical protein